MAGVEVQDVCEICDNCCYGLWMLRVTSLVPRPPHSFPPLHRTASNRKLGEDLGTRLMSCMVSYICTQEVEPSP